MLDGVNNRVSFVDNIITVEAAVVRDRDIPLEHLLVSVCVNIHTSVTEMYPLLLSTENTRTKNHHAMSSRIPRKKNDPIHEFEINDILGPDYGKMCPYFLLSGIRVNMEFKFIDGF